MRPKPRNRRQFLRDATGTIVGVVIGAALTPLTSQAVLLRQRTFGEPAVVGRHEGDVVYVAGRQDPIPISGFPAGWQLQPGDKVVLTSEPNSRRTVAMPLASWHIANLDSRAVRSGSRLVINDLAYDLPFESAVTTDGGEGNPTQRYGFFVVDRSTYNTTPRIIAIRPV